MKSKVRSVLLNLFLVFLSLAILFVVLEVGARLFLWRFATHDQFRKYASIYQRAQDNLTDSSGLRLAYNPFALCYPAPNYQNGKCHHNSMGYRDDEIVMPKPAGEFRIACLGGSTTYDEYIDDNDLTYPKVLQAELRKRGFNVSVINAGCPGYVSHQVFSAYAFRVSYLDVDMVLVYEGVNDWARRMTWPIEKYTSDCSGNQGILALFSPSLSVHEILNNSSFLRILAIKSGWSQPSASLTALQDFFLPHSYSVEYYVQASMGKYPSDIFKDVPAEKMMDAEPPVYYAHNLESLAMLALARKAQIAFATFVYSQELNKLPLDCFLRGIREMNDTTRAVANKVGAKLIDLEKSYPSSEEYWADPYHNTVMGARIKAQLIADDLCRSNAIPAQFRTLPAADVPSSEPAGLAPAPAPASGI